jgi:hypothetical protein
MPGNKTFAKGTLAACVAILCGGALHADAQDKYSVKVPGGLAFSEFRGYENWQTIGVSHGENALAAILGNPEMIEAYESGIPDNGNLVPNGAKMAKIVWAATASKTFPGPTVQGDIIGLQFMVKDSERFADSGGWGYAIFRYDSESGAYRPGTTQERPPQGNDATCGFACHTVVRTRDYVFTEYAKR